VKRIIPYLGIFALALGVRAGHINNFGGYAHEPPGRSECEIAASSVSRGGPLGNIFVADSGPSAHLAPLYPWLLGQVYRIDGCTSPKSRTHQETLVTLVTCLGICLIPLIGRQAGLKPAAGWLAAFVVSVYPRNELFETSGDHEQPFVTVGLTLLLFAFIRLHEVGWRSPLRVLIAAVLMGILALVGPTLLGVASLLVAAELLTQRGNRKHVMIGALAIAATTTAILFPWAYRNHCELGGWVWTRSNFGLELAIGNNSKATGYTYHTQFFELHPVSSKNQQQEYLRLGELEYVRTRGAVAKAWIRDNPGAFIRLTIVRAELYCFPPREFITWDTKQGLIVYVLAFLSLGTIAGLFGLFWGNHPYRWLFLAVIVGFALPHLITHVEGRYRYPLFGLSVLLTVDFLCRIASWFFKGAANPLPLCSAPPTRGQTVSSSVSLS